MMKNILLLLIFCFFAINSTAQKKINWVSFEEAIELNKVSKKPILVDVYTDWCGWCKKMDMETYSNQVIVNFINKNYHAVKFNGEGKEEVTFKGYTFKYEKNGRRGYHQLAATLLSGKLSYPATVFLDSNAEVIQNVPGYIKKERFEKVLAFFTEQNYQTTKWEDFEKSYEGKI